MFANICAAPGLPPVPFIPAIPSLPRRWVLPAEDASAGRARRWAGAELPRLVPPGGQPPGLADGLALATSELVTNAVRHGPRPPEDRTVELSLWRGDGYLWIAVSDAGDGRLPVRLRPESDARGGRGLLLVDAVCDVRAVLPRTAAGKSVVAGFWLHRADRLSC